MCNFLYTSGKKRRGSLVGHTGAWRLCSMRMSVGYFTVKSGPIHSREDKTDHPGYMSGEI